MQMSPKKTETLVTFEVEAFSFLGETPVPARQGVRARLQYSRVVAPSRLGPVSRVRGCRCLALLLPVCRCRPVLSPQHAVFVLLPPESPSQFQLPP